MRGPWIFLCATVVHQGPVCRRLQFRGGKIQGPCGKKPEGGATGDVEPGLSTSQMTQVLEGGVGGLMHSNASTQELEAALALRKERSQREREEREQKKPRLTSLVRPLVKFPKFPKQ